MALEIREVKCILRRYEAARERERQLQTMRDEFEEWRGRRRVR